MATSDMTTFTDSDDNCKEEGRSVGRNDGGSSVGLPEGCLVGTPGDVGD